MTTCQTKKITCTFNEDEMECFAIVRGQIADLLAEFPNRVPGYIASHRDGEVITTNDLDKALTVLRVLSDAYAVTYTEA